MLNSIGSLKLGEKEDLVQPLIQGIIKQNPEDLKKFFEIFSDDIYNFPIKYYNFNEDDAGDFYLYAFEHLKNGKKIGSFQYKSKFTTWFFSVLRNLVIDFLRATKNKLKYTTFLKSDNNGNLIDTLQNIPDEHLSRNEDTSSNEIVEKFVKSIDSLKIYNRVLFKLAYIHYIEFTREELEWLCETNNLEEIELLQILSKLKEIGLRKANEVKKIEDKLTANFQSIILIQQKIIKYFNDNPTLQKDESAWSEDYENPKFSPELIKFIQILMKKKKKHAILLNSQEKSLLSTRIPYKEFSSLLKTSDGVLSVQLLRIIKKIGEEIDN